MKKNIIKFNLVDEIEYANVPKPSKNYIPDWYKKLKPFTSGDYTLNTVGVNDKYSSQKTAKKCVPFLDTMTSGYMLETWCDIEVKEKDMLGEKSFEIGWLELDWHMIEPRAETPGLGAPPGYFSSPVSLKTPYYIKTPPGYSILLTQPFNRFDLPFFALSGIVDTDKHPLFPGSFPIYVKRNSYGVIPKGTPIVQIIPFKRENWVSERDEDLKKEGSLARRSALSVVQNWYRENAWSKKSYE
jgi:hypothetical protein